MSFTTVNILRRILKFIKGYDAYTAIRELNEYVCVEGKRLNHFVHQKVRFELNFYKKF